jgi:hypothetical protein
MGHVNGDDDGIGYGVGGLSTHGTGVAGGSASGTGVFGTSYIYAGVYAYSYYGFGVYGGSYSRDGVYGTSYWGNGVVGHSTSGNGVYGTSYRVNGVYGWSDSGLGVRGYSESGSGVYGESPSGYGVYGKSDRFIGVYGESRSGYGMYGWSDSGTGVYGWSNSGYAAFLNGRVYIRGPLEKPGGSFKIDHPLDPANKYLHHSFVESPDMKNVYDGVVLLDDKGEAQIELPDWFGALNKDFRYQLTAVGAPGPNLHIAEEVSDTTTNYNSNSSNNNNSHFKIAGGTSGMKVSWQVTGIRKDPWANANRIQVEEDKPDKERGYYIYPDLYGQPEEKEISRLLFPEEKQELLINENKLT